MSQPSNSSSGSTVPSSCPPRLRKQSSNGAPAVGTNCGNVAAGATVTVATTTAATTTVPKSGPLKATIPMSSVLKSTASTCDGSASASTVVGISPSLSPTVLSGGGWRPSRMSPDRTLGQRSPGSAAHKAKSKTLGRADNVGGGVMRRTASLDALYLQGQWPRESYYFHAGMLQIDKATQTEDWDWTDSRKIHCIAESEDKLEKIIMQMKLQRNSASSQSSQLHQQQTPSHHSRRSPSSPCNITNMSPSCFGSLAPRAIPMNIPIKPLPRPTLRSSVEGLNQEIEGLVLKSASSGGSHSTDRQEDFDKATPEGHRAPFPDLFRHTRSVNTQTPSARELTGSCHSSSTPSRNSLSPMIPGYLESSASDADNSNGSSPEQDEAGAVPGMGYCRNNSRSSSSRGPAITSFGGCAGGGFASSIGSCVKLGSSPQLFLARGPPDGCEKVQLLKTIGGQEAGFGGEGGDGDRLRSASISAAGGGVDAVAGGAPVGPQTPCTTFQLKQSHGSAFQLLQRQPHSNQSGPN